MNRRLDKGNGLARWSKAGSTTTPCPPTFACSVRSASMLSTSGGARSGGAARRTSRHGKGSKVSRVNGCLLPRSSIRGRLTASASNPRGGSRMRESRPYGSERGAFSNGRPYRDRIDDHRGAGRSRAIRLFDSQCALWFLANYEDPVKSTPYDGAQGGYQYQCGGRYSAREELMRRFYAGLETRFRRR